MRSIIVGTPAERRRLREQFEEISGDILIAAEFDSLAEARASGVVADMILLASPPAAPDDELVFEALTPRENEVLELLAEGLSNKGIAERLGISDQTIKFHVASICGKLGASNRTDAVRRAARRGLIVL